LSSMYCSFYYNMNSVNSILSLTSHLLSLNLDL